MEIVDGYFGKLKKVSMNYDFKKADFEEGDDHLFIFKTITSIILILKYLRALIKIRIINPVNLHYYTDLAQETLWDKDDKQGTIFSHSLDIILQSGRAM